MTCWIDGNQYRLDDIQKLGWNRFAESSIYRRQSKIYKYYSNAISNDTDANGMKKPINYSQVSLKANTVYMQNPLKFDDPYDCSLFIDYERFLSIRAQYYLAASGEAPPRILTYEEAYSHLSARMNSALQESSDFVKSLRELFKVNGNDYENQVKELFLRQCLSGPNGKNAGLDSITAALADEYQTLKDMISNTFRVSCFATSPYNMLMWSGIYADCHKGFCVEYDIDPNRCNEKISIQLHPVIYSDSRTDCTEILTRSFFSNGPASDEFLWDVYFHGILRKSLDWKHQNEWRLVFANSHTTLEENISFYPISKVFLGNRMPAEKRSELIYWCNENDIPYAGISIAPGKYVMEDCSILCENCKKYQSDLNVREGVLGDSP